MKRLIYIFMVIALVCTVITMTSVSVFAEGTEGGEIVDEEVEVAPEEGDETVDEEVDAPAEDDESVGGDTEALPGEDDEVVEGDGTTDGEENNTESAPAGFPFEEELNAIKEKLFGFIGKVWNFIQNDETYKTIFGVVAAIAAALLLPIFFGIVVIVYFIIAVIYLAIGAMTAISAALASIVAMIVSIVMQFLPL